MRIAMIGAIALTVTALLAPTAQAAAPTSAVHFASARPAAKVAKVVTFSSCAKLHKKFPHGVGKPGARDKVRGKHTRPVTNFTRSLAWYNANKKSDRDRDGVACEKH